MCDTCGCTIIPNNVHLVEGRAKLAHSEDGKAAVTVLTSLLQENDHQAGHNRAHFDHHRTLAINLMSAPGSGKTALLETTISALKDEFKLAAIEGDLETENDAIRVRAKGIPVVQITTGSACHLDAHMVHTALHELDLDGVDIVFIENVGNLVCPASFDLGHHLNVTLLSVTEGDDKPAKYPVMFRTANLLLITKTDLLAVLEEFNPEVAEGYLRKLANPAPVIHVSARTGDGLADWLNWLRQALATYRAELRRGETLQPGVQLEDIHRYEGESRLVDHHPRHHLLHPPY